MTSSDRIRNGFGILHALPVFVRYDILVFDLDILFPLPSGDLFVSLLLVSVEILDKLGDGGDLVCATPWLSTFLRLSRHDWQGAIAVKTTIAVSTKRGGCGF